MYEKLSLARENNSSVENNSGGTSKNTSIIENNSPGKSKEEKKFSC